MAFLNPLCSFVLFLLVSVTHVQTQNAECSVDNRFVEIKENNHPGLVITNINADPGITVTIKPSTAAGSPTSEWFEIKGSQLILNERVDFESISVIQLDLICWKGNEEVKKLLVIITIGNENDNAPVFKETNITVDVAEDTKVNTIVVPLANVTATDVDLDVLFYRLKGSPPEAMDYFNIQGINNPQIYLRKALNYEAINFMEFTLSAMDGSAGAAGTHTATATISIRVVESDLRPPWFQPCTALGGRIVCISLGYTSKVNLSEYVSGPLILEPGPLYAIDGERSLNEKVVYEIAAGNDNDTFLINRDSGNITMNKSANTLKTFTLYIVASQDNNPFRYSQTTVKIDVVRKNDNHPYFEKTFYTGRVSVDQPAKTLIMKTNTSSEPLQIFAADDDFLPDKINPDIKYRIQNSSDFRVTADGFIQTTVVLNVSSHITLSAIATDTNTLEEASTLISVDVAPLATSTVPPVATTASTETSPATPEKWTASSKPSVLPPGISSPQPATSSGSTKSMSPPPSTTGNVDLTKITGNPVTVTMPGSVISPFVTTLKPPVSTGNSSQLLTTGSPVTGTSQQTLGSVRTSSASTQAPPQPGATEPPTTGRFVTTNGGTVQPLTSSQTAITKTPVAGTSPAPDGGKHPTTGIPLPGITNPSTKGTSTAKSVPSASLPSTTARSTSSIANSPATSRTTISYVTSKAAFISSKKPSTQGKVTPSVNESHKTVEPSNPPMSSTTSPEAPAVPPVATTASTETSPATPEKWTASSKPSVLPPGISSPQPATSSGSTKSMSPPPSTTGNVDLTKITGNPVTVTMPGSVIVRLCLLPSKTQTLWTSQQTLGSVRTSSASTQAPPQPGATEPPTTGRFVTTNGGTVQPLTSSQTAITKTPIAGPYSVEDMAALGATLGSLLAIALALLALMSCKYYKLKKELEKDSLKITEDFSNANFQDDEKSNSGGKDDQSPASIMSKSYAEEKEPEGNQTQTAPETIQEEETVDRDSEKEVRSILTKERKMEDDGYKAVWFREDVVPEAKSDIVMIEDDSDLEQSRTGSENDSTAVEDDFSDDTDSGRGDSDINVSPGRAQLLNTNPSASQSLEEAEENDDAL